MLAEKADEIEAIIGIRLHNCIYHKISCMKGSTTLSKKMKGNTNTNSHVHLGCSFRSVLVGP
jgi:hypothetical protein